MRIRNYMAEQIAGMADRMKNRIAASVAEALARHLVPWTTYAYNGGIRGGTGTGPTFSPHKFSVTEVKLDFAAIKTDRAAAGLAALGAADVLELVGCKAGIWVPMVALQVTVVEGAVATADLGDGTTPAGFVSNADQNVLGWTTSLVTTTYSLATAGGKLYTADDTIDMVLDNAAVDVCVCKVIVPQVDLRSVT